MIEAASTSGSRPFLAYGGDGHFLGDFAEWLPAHRWAHQRAAEPGTRLPVEIEDRGRTYAEQVWPEHYQALHSTPPVVVPSCPLTTISLPPPRLVAGDPDQGQPTGGSGDLGTSAAWWGPRS